MTTNSFGQSDLVGKRSLAGENIIRSSREIGDVVKKGKRVAGEYSSIIYSSHHRSNDVRVAFIATRKVRRAVDRNRLKRLMRELFRLHFSNLKKMAHEKGVGFDVVMMSSCTSPNISLKDIEKDFEQFVLRISKEPA